jgi:mRNA-degrading endonuclease YafQ of YafQ-DinJ toxin-antitoxin module
MTRLILTKIFVKDLNALKTRHSNNYRKANSVLMELQRGEQPTAHLRDETRIPKVLKFQLDPDFRLLLQRVDGEDALIALSVGNHDHVDSFLDGHKGWVFDPTTGNIRELRLATATEEATQIVASQSLQAERAAEVMPPPLSHCRLSSSNSRPKCSAGWGFLRSSQASLRALQIQTISILSLC